MLKVIYITSPVVTFKQLNIKIKTHDLAFDIRKIKIKLFQTAWTSKLHCHWFHCTVNENSKFQTENGITLLLLLATLIAFSRVKSNTDAYVPLRVEEQTDCRRQDQESGKRKSDRALFSYIVIVTFETGS